MKTERIEKCIENLIIASCGIKTIGAAVENLTNENKFDGVDASILLFAIAKKLDAVQMELETL
jgi:hypothetical protein